MANAEDELSAEGLKAYIDGHGGKVKNLDLVAHYSSALKHPKNKGDIFYLFVIACAIIKNSALVLVLMDYA